MCNQVGKHAFAPCRRQARLGILRQISATTDLSDRKHEYIGTGSGGSAQPTRVPRNALTIFSRIFLDLQPVRCSDFEQAGGVHAGAQALFALASSTLSCLKVKPRACDRARMVAGCATRSQPQNSAVEVADETMDLADAHDEAALGRARIGGARSQWPGQLFQSPNPPHSKSGRIGFFFRVARRSSVLSAALPRHHPDDQAP
jgi:hypothetical protein